MHAQFAIDLEITMKQTNMMLESITLCIQEPRKNIAKGL